jgi:uncharacterized protein YggE
MGRGVRKLQLVVAIFAVALLLPASAPALERTVTVKGTATQEVPNDAASVGLSVSKVRSTRQAALGAVAAGLNGVIATAQTFPGVGPGDITTGRISVRKLSRGKRQHYRAAEGISVILHQPERAGELISAAIAAGATGSSGPNFFPSDPELAYRNTLIAAFDLAKAKALALAIRAEATLGPAITIEEGTDVVPIEGVRKGATGVDDAPAPPTKPGGSTVTATVRVVFSLL